MDIWNHPRVSNAFKANVMYGRIDTTKTAVYMLTGEYDWNTTPEMSRETAAQIDGASFYEMTALGHFPMSEAPDTFRAYLMPVLEEIQKTAGN